MSGMAPNVKRSVCAQEQKPSLEGSLNRGHSAEHFLIQVGHRVTPFPPCGSVDTRRDVRQNGLDISTPTGVAKLD